MQTEKIQRQRTALPGVGGATRLKNEVSLTATGARLVTGASHRHVATQKRLQTRSGRLEQATRAERPDRAVLSPALRKESLAPSAYAPHSINFGPLKVNRVARATVTVLCPSDGEVSALYKSKLSQSRIVQLSVFGGDWSSDEPQSASPVLVATSSSGRIATRAGQELRVELEFRSSQVGRIDGMLELVGESWRVRVPTTAAVSLLGPLVGALVLPVERALTGITGTVLEVPMRVLSLSPAGVTARLTPQELPAGVSAEPFSLSIGPGQTLSGTLRLRLSESAPECLEAPLRFLLETSGSAATGEVRLSVNLYQPWKEFRFYASDNANLGSFVRFEGVVQIKADGSWNLEAMGSNYGTERATLSFAFKGFGAAGRLYTETVTAKQEYLIRRSGTSLWLKEHYGEAIRAGVVATAFE